MGTDYYFIVTYLEDFLDEQKSDELNKSVRSAFTDFFHFSQIVEPDFEFSVVYILGRMKNYEERELLDLVSSLSWVFPETLQIMVRSEHEERYHFIEFDRPKRYRHWQSNDRQPA